nr:hypothetical protein BaRGS_025148 [Batillaria attramentaria]
MHGDASFNAKGNTVYKLHAKGTNIVKMPWGQTLFTYWHGVKVFVYIDQINNFAVFYVPDCSTRIKFRPFNRDLAHAAQEQLPGVTILAPASARWDLHGPEFPFSMCGTPNDSPRIMYQLARAEGLNNRNQRIIQAAMEQYILPQDLNSNGYSDACRNAGSDFADCSAQNRPQALRLCSAVLLKSKLVRCQLEQGQNVMDNFVNCLFHVCELNPTVGAHFCQDFATNMAACSQFLTSALQAFTCA